jgi:hypothetical protein
MRVSCISLALLLLSSSLFAAHTPLPAVPQEVFAPFWSVQPGWQTELMIGNNTGSKITVVPVLRSRSGVETQLEPIEMAPNDGQMLSVADVLSRVAPRILTEPDAYGSVVFRYTARTVGNVYASVLLKRTGSPIEFHFDAAQTMPEFETGAYQSIWWKPSYNQQDTLVLANVFGQPLHGTMRIFDAQGHSTAHPFTLAARETQQVSVTELLSKYGITGEFGGITIEPQDHPGYLQVMHFTVDEAAGVGALLKVMPRFPLLHQQYTVRAPMLALSHPDPALALPPETLLSPRVFLFNGTAHPVAAHALLDWHSASLWGRAPLPSLTVAPGATQVLSLEESQIKRLGVPSSATWASVQLSYASADSDLVAMAASLSADGKHLVQTPFSDTLSFKYKGGQWMVDADHDALITTGNAGTKPARLDFKLRYAGGSQIYELPARVLQPGEAITIDVGKIITNQQPDRSGKAIPPSIMSGTYEFSDLDDIGMGYLYEGKQQIDKTYGHATYGCIPCCYYTAAWITDFAGTVGDQGSIPALADESCPNGDYVGVDVTSLTTAWASGDSNIATVTPSLVHAVGAGQTYSSGISSLRTLRVHNEIYTCPGANFLPRGNISVSAPTFNNAYSAYIPVDHITGPLKCLAQYDLLYMGDGNRGTYRSTESINIVPDTHSSSGFFADTGQTRNYSRGSPVNGNTLSSADEDGIPDDCILWNDAGKADPSGFSHDESFPYSHQGQSHFAGSTCNPLEPCATIDWDMRTVIDTSNPQAPTAYVNYNHTCYPAHQVKVNGQVVYNYTPPSNDPSYVSSCLLFKLNKRIGQTQPVPVPTH